MLEQKLALESGMKYDNRFKESDIETLKEFGVPPEIANKYTEKTPAHYIGQFYKRGYMPDLVNQYYSKRNLGIEVLRLLEENIDPQIFHAYGIGASDVITLKRLGCSAEEFKSYDKRFMSWEIIELYKSGCTSKDANVYDQRFSSKDVIALFAAKLPIKFISEYDTRFSGEEISMLYSADIKPQLANEYDKRFNGFQIIKLFKDSVNPDEVHKYPKRIKPDDLVDILTSHSPSEWWKKYDKHFNDKDKKILLRSHVPPDIANEYAPRFDGSEIRQLLMINCKPEIAFRYDEKFSGDDIRSLREFKKISPKKANAYPKDFTADDIYWMHSRGFDKEKIKEYDKRFKHDDIAKLVHMKCSPYEANKYNKKLRGYEVIKLVEVKCPPEKASEYLDYFSCDDIKYLFQAGCDIKTALKYQKAGFPQGWHIAPLFENNVSPEKAREYVSNNIFPHDAVELIQAGCSPEIAFKYPYRFKGEHIADMFKIGCLPEIAEQYAENFSTLEIIDMFKAGCMPKTANKYPLVVKHSKEPFSTSGFYISLLYSVGITAEKLSSQEFYKFEDVLSKLYDVKSLRDGTEKFDFVATGFHSVIFLNKEKDIASKIDGNISTEYDLLERIKRHNKNPKNIINFQRAEMNDNKITTLQTIYIKGTTLEQAIMDNSIDSKKIIKYSKDILNGLLEMRAAGIRYHRDIRPANIMIDYDKDRAVIIDLGFATSNESDLTRVDGNRRFNGPNDLSSLGQLIYFMCTGTSVFAESVPKSKNLLDIADEIFKKRSEVYNDNSGVLMDLTKQKVDYKIKNNKLSSIINALLTAGKDDYEMAYQLFERPIKGGAK